LVEAYLGVVGCSEHGAEDFDKADNTSLLAWIRPLLKSSSRPPTDLAGKGQQAVFKHRAGVRTFEVGSAAL